MAPRPPLAGLAPSSFASAVGITPCCAPAGVVTTMVAAPNSISAGATETRAGAAAYNPLDGPNAPLRSNNNGEVIVAWLDIGFRFEGLNGKSKAAR